MHVSGWVKSIHGQQKQCCVFGQALSPCHGQQVHVKAGATADDSCHTDTLFPSALLATERSRFEFSGFKVVKYSVPNVWMGCL